MTTKQIIYVLAILAVLVTGWCLMGAIANGPAKASVSHAEPRSLPPGTSG